MKKLLVALLAIGILGFMATPALVSAQGEQIPSGCNLSEGNRTRIESIMGENALTDAESGTGTSTYTGLPCLLNTLMTAQQYLFWIILVVALIMMLVGAFQFLTAGGSEEQTGDAQQTLIYALVGVAVAFLARFAIDAVINMLG